MASIWMLSKDAMRGMDIIGSISDFLDEYHTKGEPTSESTERVLGVLDNLLLGARSFIGSGIRIDSFSMMLAEAVFAERGETPTDLINALKACSEQIRLKRDIQNQCLVLLRLIGKTAVRVTSRRVDTKSLILH